MDITPTRMGASVDVTEDAHHLIDLIADAFDSDPEYVAERLRELAQARRELRELKVAEAASRDVSDQRMEQAACAVDGIRDELVDLLDQRERITVTLTWAGCEQDARKLTEAAAAAKARFVPVTHLMPSQRDRRDAA